METVEEQEPIQAETALDSERCPRHGSRVSRSHRCPRCVIEEVRRAERRHEEPFQREESVLAGSACQAI